MLAAGGQAWGSTSVLDILSGAVWYRQGYMSAARCSTTSATATSPGPRPWSHRFQGPQGLRASIRASPARHGPDGACFANSRGTCAARSRSSPRLSRSSCRPHTPGACTTHPPGYLLRRCRTRYCSPSQSWHHCGTHQPAERTRPTRSGRCDDGLAACIHGS